MIRHALYQCCRFLTAVCISVAVVVGENGAVAKEPPVPPGLSASGVVIALLGSGIDYRVPELARRLARDGEGVLISWDLVDGDTQPFAEKGATAAGQVIAEHAPGALISIVKEQPGDPQSFGRMMSFVARTPARIVVWLDGEPNRPDWPILAQAIKRFGDRLFVIPAGERGRDLDRWAAYDGVRRVSNALVVASGGAGGQANFGAKTVDMTVSDAVSDQMMPSQQAALVIAAVAARALDLEPARSMAELKSLILRHDQATSETLSQVFAQKK